MYGSALTIVTVRPRASSSAPIDAEATPLPSDDTTPPVTKMNLVLLASLLIAHLHPQAPPPPTLVSPAPSLPERPPLSKAPRRATRRRLSQSRVRRLATAPAF